MTLGPGVTAASGPPCEGVVAHRSDTVIVFEAPSTFTMCRGGAEQRDVVAGDAVYLELAPSPGASLFDYRLRSPATETGPTGLSEWARRARELAHLLRELAGSQQSIADAPLGPPASTKPAMAPVVTARASYLGVVTPRFIDLLGAVRNELHLLHTIVGSVGRWCDVLSGTRIHADATAELRATCPNRPTPGEVEHRVAAFEDAVGAFDSKRIAARESLVRAIAHPDDAAIASAAASALDDARDSALDVKAKTLPLAQLAETLSHESSVLRVVASAMHSLRPGDVTYLATYGGAANAELAIDALPRDIGEAGDEAARKSLHTATFRFPVVDRHYLDLELGLGVTAGLPQFPAVATQNNVSVVEGKPVEEFVALALVELEPLRFWWPDRDFAGVVRFPVVAVPLTRDPTQNFFAGAGLGATGVGSITAGPYFLRELTLREGHAIGETLPPGTNFNDITQPNVRLGYFVSASVDVVGLYHLFVPRHVPTVDAATGKEK